MVNQFCSIDTCKRPSRARGWCTLHYNRWQAHGDPLTRLVSRRRAVTSVCSIPDCRNKHEARTWCANHYALWRNNGDPLTHHRVGNGEYKGKCLVSDCGIERNCRGMCVTHYRKWRYQQGVGSDSPESRAAAKRDRRAKKYGPQPNPFTGIQWEYIQTLCGHTCVYCKQTPEKLEQDHVVPLSRGGAHTSSNVVPACGGCNRKKHTKSIGEFQND